MSDGAWMWRLEALKRELPKLIQTPNLRLMWNVIAEAKPSGAWAKGSFRGAATRTFAVDGWREDGNSIWLQAFGGKRPAVICISHGGLSIKEPHQATSKPAIVERFLITEIYMVQPGTPVPSRLHAGLTLLDNAVDSLLDSVGCSFGGMAYGGTRYAGLILRILAEGQHPLLMCDVNVVEDSSTDMLGFTEHAHLYVKPDLRTAMGYACDVLARESHVDTVDHTKEEQRTEETTGPACRTNSGSEKGWQSLKDWEEEEARHNGCPPQPVRRNADGSEVWSRLDAFASEVRELWARVQPHLSALAVEKRELDSDDLLAVTGCQAHVWRVFHCLREAEGWFYRVFGPGGDLAVLDPIADALSEILYVCEELLGFGVNLHDDQSCDELHDLITGAVESLYRASRAIENSTQGIASGTRARDQNDEQYDVAETDESATDGSVPRSVAEWLWRLGEIRKNLPLLLPSDDVRCLLAVSADCAEGTRPPQVGLPPDRVRSSGMQGLAGIRISGIGELEFGDPDSSAAIHQSLSCPRRPGLSTRNFLYVGCAIADLWADCPSAILKKLVWAKYPTGKNGILFYSWLFDMHPLLTARETWIESEEDPYWTRVSEELPGLALPCLVLNFEHDWRSIIGFILDAIRDVISGANQGQCGTDERQEREGAGEQSPGGGSLGGRERAVKPPAMERVKYWVAFEWYAKQAKRSGKYRKAFCELTGLRYKKKAGEFGLDTLERWVVQPNGKAAIKIYREAAEVTKYLKEIKQLAQASDTSDAPTSN